MKTGDKVFYKDRVYLFKEAAGEYCILTSLTDSGMEFPARVELVAPVHLPDCIECGATPPRHKNGCRTGIFTFQVGTILDKVNNHEEFIEAGGEIPTEIEIKVRRDRVISSLCFVQAIDALMKIIQAGECPVEWAGGFCQCRDFMPTKEQVAIGELAMLKLAEIGLVLSQVVHHPDSPFGQSLPVVYYLQQRFANAKDKTMAG